ncbi:MAG: protein-export chaperone SecB [Chromatiales bacterium]|nr:MAG: protein-export chaperone SecB [Chromatiales bacterium]
MTDSIKGATNGNGSDSRQFLLQQLFVKDLSFEAPNAPVTLQGASGEPDVKLNLRHSSRALDGDAYEVVLHLSVHAELAGKTVFLAELDQAGLFIIKGYQEEERRQLLGVYCPNTLFPYAREAISSTVARGGFPPLMLQPINFEALYAQAAAQQEGQA